MARYRITPEDEAFVAEFLSRPFGYKSPGLQRVLNLMRGQGPEGKYVLIVREPYRRWGLGRLPARRGDPIAEIAGIEYLSLAEGERDVFLRRWRDLTGSDAPASTGEA
ncbi:hypothetical protein FHS85_001974 [Rhodoligotrophos appendicifer]|uniref:hypothetical protein n=1 Tax=Rhodoligotrophos appendicifer TaxID=987056 RepID=UPI0011854DD5|nr:hypothetical protein [Rhodoligotrophos appendicifer]